MQGEYIANIVTSFCVFTFALDPGLGGARKRKREREREREEARSATHFYISEILAKVDFFSCARKRTKRKLFAFFFFFPRKAASHAGPAQNHA